MTQHWKKKPNGRIQNGIDIFCEENFSIMRLDKKDYVWYKTSIRKFNRKTINITKRISFWKERVEDINGELSINTKS